MSSAEKKQLNVLLVSQYLQGGGLERMVHLLGACLHKEFHCKVELFNFDLEADPKLVKHLNEQGLEITHLQKGSGFSLRTVWALACLIWRRKADIIHTHETAPLMYAVIARFLSLRFGVKIVHTQHSFIHLQTRSFIRFYDNFFSRFASTVTVVSEQVQNEYLKMGVSRERVLLIQNGVEFPKNRLDAAAKKELRKEFSEIVPALKSQIDATWLMALARVHPKKGQDHLIRMWGALPESSRRKSLLLFVGPETDAGEVKRLREILSHVPDRDRVIFVGSTQTPVRWLQSADVYLSASEYEGMPLAPIEACGAGLPVVLSDIQGHQVLKDQAWLFDFSKPEDIARAVSTCLVQRDSDPAGFANSCAKSMEKIQSLYSISKMTGQYYDIYSR